MELRFAALVPIFVFLTVVARAQDQSAPIPFTTVEQARKALSAQSGMQVSEQQGWLIVTDQKEMTLWSFTPRGLAAYPAAVRRRVVRGSEEIYVETTALCEAEKAACDRLIADFKKLNDSLIQGIDRKRSLD